MTPPRSGKGRRKPSLTDAKLISSRLQRHIRKRYLAIGRSRADFARKVGLAETTVTGWFSTPPKTPDTAHLIALGRIEKINLHWVLLGDGPELIEPSTASETVEDMVWARVVAEMKFRQRFGAITVEKVVERPRKLLDHLVDLYWRTTFTQTLRRTRKQTAKFIREGTISNPGAGQV